MIFQSANLIPDKGSFVFSGEVHAVAHPCLNKEITKEFWHNFSFRSSSLTVSACDEYCFTVGNAEKCSLGDDAYRVSIQTDGICICAKDEKSLLRGYMMLLDRFSAIDLADGTTAVSVDCCRFGDPVSVGARMVHYCIFPETELWELKRFVRFCGALKYTHIVLEFWGMLKYDCMKELAWSHGFTKEEIRPIIAEAHDLGMEVIPMFNHWGHASAGRVLHAKHVVLDQNPALQTYFSEDGWCWDISKQKVRDLLREIRRELIELCGEGSYFHIGCDEAYNFELNEENMTLLCEFINGIDGELSREGRRAIIWGDMMLYRKDSYNPDNRYSCHAPSPDVGPFMLKLLNRHVVIADWQYHAKHAPVETEAFFREAGFDCLLCPWDEGREQMNAVLDTVREKKLMGFMHTTWHTLSSGMPYVMLAAIGGIRETNTLDFHCVRTRTAALLRKVMPCNGDYRHAGTAKQQIYDKW